MISLKNIPSRFYRKLRSIVLHERSDLVSNPCFISHSALNRKSRKNEIVLRPGLKINITPESRFGFEFFCFRDEGMIREFDCFLDIACTKKNYLDVGALHGIFSLSFTVNRPGTKAIAVDPSSLAFPKLQQKYSYQSIV